MDRAPTLGRAAGCPRCHHRHLPSLPCWGGRYVARLAALVRATYGDRCTHCGGPDARSVEHVQPRSLGGTDALANLRPAHLSCNISRGIRPMPTGPVTVETSSRW